LIGEIASTQEWVNEALCAQVGPEDSLWFPDKGQSNKQAKLICAECPVRQQCLQYALDRSEQHGIWGGLSDRERKELKRGIRPPRMKCRKGHDLNEAGTRPNGECAECSRERSRRAYTPRPPMERRKGREHGTRSRYTIGCRCDSCRDANTRYQRDRQWLRGA
jgi:hypothetical protein